MPDIADTLADVALRLEEAVSGLGTGEGAEERVQEAVAACLVSLRSVSGEAERAAADSVELVRLAARGSENVDLAGLFLEREEQGGDGAVHALQTALFHARRAFDYFQMFLEDLTYRTRAVDRERNREEFLSG